MRIASLDRLRGLVIALMALDHARHFFQPAGRNPEDWDSTTWPFFLMRWVTHFCAPVFVLLAGVSVGIYLPKHEKMEGVRFLLTRGLWLMLLEPTWISFSWFFSFESTHLGIMWAIGGAMVGLSTLLWLPRWAVGAVGLAITLWLSAMPELVGGETLEVASFGRRLLEMAVHPGGYEIGDHWIQQTYVILPWLAVMALGYGLAGVVQDEALRKKSWMLGLGVVIAFALLRLNNGLGDPSPWGYNPRPGTTAMAFLSPTKYPPSLAYQLMTLGPALILLPLLGRLKRTPVLQIFGTVPMFFYLLHLPLTHGMGWLYAQAVYGAPQIPKHAPLSLGLILGAWILLLVVLWPLCKRWGALKRAHPDWRWLRYL